MKYIRTKKGVEKMTDEQYQEYILSMQPKEEVSTEKTASTETTKTGE